MTPRHSKDDVRIAFVTALLATSLHRKTCSDDAKKQMRLAECETLLSHVLEVYTRVLGKDHLYTLKAFNNLAFNYVLQGKDDKAVPMFQDLLQKRRQLTGLDHIDTFICAQNLGDLLIDSKRDEEARSIYLEFLPVAKRVLGEEHPRTLSMITDYGRCLFYLTVTRSEVPKVLAMIEANLAVQQRVLGRDEIDSRRTTSVLTQLRKIFAQSDRHADTLS
jgi:tetratricopeptide (TPR) repeat protein